MKKVVLGLVFAFVAIFASAQSYTEEVHLKNGSIIRGVIIEQVPNKSLRIQTRCGSEFVYTMDEIAKITKSSSSNRMKHNCKGIKLRQPGSDLLKTGFKSFVDLGHIFGDRQGHRIEVTASIGSQLNQYLFIGGGLGANYYTESDFFVLPIFLDAKAYVPTGTSIHPFINIRPGFGLENGGNYDGGFYISTLAGIEIKHFSIGIGYTSQSFETDSFVGDYRFTSSGFTAKVGIVF